MVIIRPSPSQFEDTRPPFHTIVTVVSLLVLCMSSIPHVNRTIDDVATIEAITIPLFFGGDSDDIVVINRKQILLGQIRLLIASFMLLVTLYFIVFEKERIFKTNYLKQSRLKSYPVKVKGLYTQYYFTSWCWNLQILSFALNGVVTLLAATDGRVIVQPTMMKWLLRASFIINETSAALSLFVSVVVRYILWPVGLKGHGSDSFKNIIPLLQHNVNVILALSELLLLGGAPVRIDHVMFAPMFGIVYVVFVWVVRGKWMLSTTTGGEERQVLQFPYFFLDTTLGPITTFAIVGLLVILFTFYSVLALASFLADAYLNDVGIVANICVVLGASFLICRFRD